MPLCPWFGFTVWLIYLRADISERWLLKHVSIPSINRWGCYFSALGWYFALRFAVHEETLYSLPPRELHSLIKAQSCHRGPSHEHLEGGISFGIGAFNLVRSQNVFCQMRLCGSCRFSRRLTGSSLPRRRSPSSPRGFWSFWSLPDSLGTRWAAQSSVEWRRSATFRPHVFFWLRSRSLDCLCCAKVPLRWTCAPCCVPCCCSATTRSSRLY